MQAGFPILNPRSSILIFPHHVAFEILIQRMQPGEHRTRLAAADRLAIKLRDCQHFLGGGGEQSSSAVNNSSFITRRTSCGIPLAAAISSTTS